MNTELIMLLCVAGCGQYYSGLKTFYINVYEAKGAQYFGAYIDEHTGFDSSPIKDDQDWPVRAEHSPQLAAFGPKRFLWSFS